jgi:hypothetical protein
VEEGPASRVHVRVRTRTRVLSRTTINSWRFSLFTYPYRLLVCRQVKPKPTTVACYKCAGHILPDHFHRCTETNRACSCYTWFPKTQRFSQLPNGTLIPILLIISDRQTYIHKYIHTNNVLGGPGWRFRRHCHASPSSTINYYY